MTTAQKASIRLVSGSSEQDDDCGKFLELLARDHTLHCAKSYRIDLSRSGLPVIPCLDHEALLQGMPPPHIAVYLEDSDQDLHEVGLIPSQKRILVDAGATLAETSSLARDRLCAKLRASFPTHTVDLLSPSLLRGDARVTGVVRSRIRLRDVLTSDDLPALRWELDQLRAIAELMEKESRVSSWGVRTMTPPLLAGAGVASYFVLGLFHAWLSPTAIEVLRYLALTALGAAFLWVGMKAVHLTEMGTRVWKRATEYRLILEARERIEKAESKR